MSTSIWARISFTVLILSFIFGSEMSMTWSKRSASMVSSKVDWNDLMSWGGRF